MAGLANLVRVNCATVGTGTLTLGSAIQGFLTPSQAGMVDATVYDYAIEADYVTLGDDMVATSREVGFGSYDLGSNTLTRNVLKSTNSNALLSLAGDAQVIICYTTNTVREILQGDRTYFVRYAVGAPTFTNASANIGLTSHGLSVNDAVVLSILPNDKTCTISNASPAVITMANSFAAGQPVVFLTAGYVPPGFVAGTTYYVIATGLSGSSFQLAATPGGAAINTPKQTFTAASGTGGALQITTSGTNNLVAGQLIAFSSSGTLPTGLSASTPYYVAASPAPTATVFYVSTTNGGTNVAFSSAGSGTHSIEQVGDLSSGVFTFGSAAIHHLRQTGAMPTFSTAGLLVAGMVYYVGTVVDANTITLSTTQNNANPLGTATVATGSPIYSAASGNDSNPGRPQNRAGAFLTIQGAYAFIKNKIDFGANVVTLQCQDSTYTAGILLQGWAGGGALNLTGDTTTPSNCFINQAGGGVSIFNGVFELYSISPGKVTITGFRILTTGTGRCHINILSPAVVDIGNMEFAGVPAGTFSNAVNCEAAGCFITFIAAVTISGNMPGFFGIAGQSFARNFSTPVSLFGVPAFDWQTIYTARSGYTFLQGMTFSGSGTGGRYAVTLNGIIDTGAAGANFFPGNAGGFVSTQGQYL
jgi:hypothetical protein